MLFNPFPCLFIGKLTGEFLFKSISIILLLISIDVFAESRETEFECASLSICIETVHEFVKSHEPDRGLSPREQAIIQRLTSFGEAAVPQLVEMLASPDIEVAQIAAAALVRADD